MWFGVMCIEILVFNRAFPYIRGLILVYHRSVSAYLKVVFFSKYNKKGKKKCLGWYTILNSQLNLFFQFTDFNFDNNVYY